MFQLANFFIFGCVISILPIGICLQKIITTNDFINLLHKRKRKLFYMQFLISLKILIDYKLKLHISKGTQSHVSLCTNFYLNFIYKQVDKELLGNPAKLLTNFQNTVDENIIATIKMRNNFCYPLEMIIFPILRQQYWSFLYCSPLSCRS